MHSIKDGKIMSDTTS